MKWRTVEKYYPVILTLVMTCIVYLTISKLEMESLVKDIVNPLLSLMTVCATVFLSFVCAMLGVIISLKSNKIYMSEEFTSIRNDLYKYTLELTVVSCISFTIAAICMFISEYIIFKIYFLFIGYCLMILEAIRVMRILFTLASENKKKVEYEQYDSKKKYITIIKK